ncbi:MAG TPA: hypothetical protein VNP90_07060 [Actinomycetota bacterium]|nr:hypothetical protein [Actinomycetota bacterium]
MRTRTARETARVSPAVVEMMGAPGAGKTTLLPAVLRACRDAGLAPATVTDAARPFVARTPAGRVVHRLAPANWRRPALWVLYLVFRGTSAVGFAMRHVDLARYVVDSARRRPAAADIRARRVLHWYVRLAGSYRFLMSRGRAGEALVLDEGFAHRAVQLHASPVEVPDAGRIERYTGLIPRPDLLVHVRAAVDVCEERVRSRGAWSRFSGKDPSELSRFIANAHRATELVAEAASMNGWNIIEIDNGGGDPASSAALAEQTVSTALRQLEPGG